MSTSVSGIALSIDSFKVRINSNIVYMCEIK